MLHDGAVEVNALSLRAINSESSLQHNKTTPDELNRTGVVCCGISTFLSTLRRPELNPLLPVQQLCESARPTRGGHASIASPVGVLSANLPACS